MDATKVGVLSFSLLRSMKETKMGIDGVTNFLVEQGITKMELNNWNLVLEGVPTTLATRGMRLLYKPDLIPFHTMVEALENKRIAPVVLGIDGTLLMWRKDKMHYNYVKAWLDAGHDVGIPAARIFVGWSPLPASKQKHLARTAACVAPLVKLAEERGMDLLFENYQGLSNDAEFVKALIEDVGSAHFGFVIDFANFKPKSLVYERIMQLKDEIKMVHAKTIDFNERGEETNVDYGKIASSLKHIEFDGTCLMEYIGKRDDIEGTKKTLELIMRHF
ncbi:MAG TPA: TIM barrel protein [Candidatus Lokiarchaeia archaeon]|nr:TIM barrel protein [Candidatus Lokiarchaeia archaeon]